MNAAIILFPGTNREGDMAAALRLVTGRAPHIVWHGETTLPDGTDVVVLPGGFAHGDYLRAGAMAARSPVMRAVADHAEKGGRVLGVCNGFQTLCEAGLLPGVLLRNRTLRFVCRDVTLRIEAESAFTAKEAVGRTMRVPVAHHDGNYFADAETLDRLEGEGRVVFRYVEGSNPNGATRDIAGIANEGRNVVGLMPHPEDRVEPAHGGLDGRLVFEALAA